MLSCLPAIIDFATYGSTVLVDTVQLVIKYPKDVGIDARLNTLEYGAYIARVLSGKHDSLVFGPYTPFLEPEGFLFFPYSSVESRNTSMVNDDFRVLTKEGRGIKVAFYSVLLGHQASILSARRRSLSSQTPSKTSIHSSSISGCR